MEGNEKKEWSEVETFGGMCTLSRTYNYAVCMWVTIHYALLFPHCLIAFCFIPFALCYVPINCFMVLNYSLHIYFLVLYVWLLILCVLCFCMVLCIVSLHVYSCLFSICVQFYLPLPAGRRPIAVNKYHIIYLIRK